MIIIALDEQGDFENLKGEVESLPVFIGGVIYDDLDAPNDYANEKKRLQKYLELVCSSVECRYPQDLHYADGDSGNNGKSVAKVKKRVNDTIKEFLEEGTWNNKPLLSEKREGKYHIFAILRGKNGKKNLLYPNISEAIKDDFASNLYVHMAEDVVERLIFHNPIIPNVKKIRLELATRRVLLSGNERTKRMKQYETLGFKPVQREDRTDTKVTEYLLTNPDNYRTAIEREMLNCGQDKIMIDRIGVKSIYYKSKCTGMDLLYLADAICSLLGFKLEGNTPDLWIEQFFKRSQSINSKSKNIIWSYDEVDDYFTKAWKYLEEGDYYRALSMAFDGSKYKSDMTAFYNERWFRYIGEYIGKMDDESGFSMAVKKYKESILNNNLNQEKLVYIFKNLEQMSFNVKFDSNKEESELYNLYDSGVSAYVHNSNLEEARRCFEKIEKYAKYVPTEAYLRTRNKMVVLLCDNFKFQEALKLADENVQYHDLLTDMKREIFGSSFTKSLNYAIALSQRGQVLSFMNNKKAEEDFFDALDIMDEGTPDRYITQSYLLHFYISQGLKDKYESLATEYFGNKKSLLEQFDFMAKEGSKEKNARLSLKYAIYVYTKALYTFYLDEMPDKLINRLKDIEKSLNAITKKAEKQINGHPWELTYKYLGLIMLYNNFDDEAAVYKEKIKEMFKTSEGLIAKIRDESVRCLENAKSKSDSNIEFSYMYC